MPAPGKLSASLEDYLETIFHIERERRAARAKTISKRMNVSRPSVTGALHALAERGLINYEPYELVTLTHKGRTAARDVVSRHEALRDFFVKVLGVDESKADEAACLAEHTIPPAILERFAKLVEFMEDGGEISPEGLTGFVSALGRGDEDAPARAGKPGGRKKRRRNE